MTETTKPKRETLPPEWWNEMECGGWTEWHTEALACIRMHARDMGIPPDEEAVLDMVMVEALVKTPTGPRADTLSARKAVDRRFEAVRLDVSTTTGK